MAVSRIRQFELELQRDIAQERAEAIIRESPPALGEKIAWIRDTFEEDWRRSVVCRYQVAALIREIYDDVTEHNGAVYGAKAIAAIKQAFGWDDGVIYQALHVAEAFTPQQIEEITRMRLPGGKPVSFSHVVALSGVEDEGRRQKLLKQAVREGWTSKKLANAAQFQAPEAGKREERRGRPLAKPRDFDAVLEQQASFAQDFLNRDEQVWSRREHSLSGRAEGLDTAEFTRERADRLKRHAEQMNLLAKKAKERAEEAASVHQVFEEVIRKQAAMQKKLGLAPGAPA
jgi:hypothetical protein